jgi:diacylglycerol kinase family enzyme
MRLLLLVNAAASSVTPRVKVMVTETLAAEHDITLAETSRRGHASRLAQGAAVEGYEAVIVLGGDGTVNEAANGLAGSKTALGLLPGGSTNVFARTIGFTNDPVIAAGELLGALRAPGHSVRRIGLGRANGRYFLFHAGLGFDAAVVEQVERRGSLKRFAGHPLFLYASVTTWLRYYDRRRPHFDIKLASGEELPDVYFAICVKTNPYTFLGNRPLDVAPEADLDSALTLVAMQTLALTAVARVIGATMTGRGGARLAQPGKVAYESDLTEITVHGKGPFPYQLDGDYLGEVENLELVYEADVLSLVVPE